MKALGNLLKRTIGVIMFAAIPGMATGAASGIGVLLGAANGVMTVFSSIIIYFGVQLAWDAHISDEDIEKGFRAAVAKQSQDNPEIKQALEESAAETPQLSDFGDLSELDDHVDAPLEEEEEEKP
ncbi:MAG: hypothetical protein EBR82_26045 [Caulobacteraceae bacterium]|nr:hypothetical protein [Caulobacteraceae bacterium]